MSLISCLKLLQPKFLGFQLKHLIRTMATEQHLLTLDNINPNIKNMEIPVGAILIRKVLDLEQELKRGVAKPFKEIIRTDLGDCQRMGQPPLTFVRQIMSLVFYPQLMNDSNYPADVKERAQTILKGCRGGSIGSYTEASGIDIIRKHAAEFIEKRDGIPCNWEDIWLTAGASDGIRKVLKLFINEINGKKTGVMIPIPKYPLYSLILEEFGLEQIKYYLEESQNWAINIKELQRSLDDSRKTCNPKVLVIINPGNPTGQVLTKNNIEEIIRFAHKENLYIIADEVYQFNIYPENTKFHSFKKVMFEMGEPYTNMELASFVSCSKGYMAESGVRGGFTEILNMCPRVKAMFYKANTAMLCPSVAGQAFIEPLVRFPRQDEPSYRQYQKEKEEILNSLKERAKLLVRVLNSMEGITCNESQGAMYVLPQIRLQPKVIEAAKKLDQSPDEFYCAEVLQNTGICLAPGGGFGQLPGTYHFRMSLVPIDKMKIMLERLQAFHRQFMDSYR